MKTVLNSLRWFAVLAALVAVARVSAQEPDGRGATSVRLMSWQGDLTDLLIADGGRLVPARAGEFVLGRRLDLQQAIATLRVLSPRVIEGVTTNVPVAEVALPEGATSALVVLAPAAEGSALPLQGMAIDQSFEAHPLDTLRIVNFSNQTLAVRVGEESALIKPREESRFAFPAAGRPHLPVEVAVQTAEGWKMVQRSLQPMPPGRRVLGVVREGRPDLTIEDAALRIKPVDAIFMIDRSAPPVSAALAQR